MRDSIGGSALMYLVIIFITVVMILFSSILTYSKGYKIKNRIVEIIEKYGEYEMYDQYGKNLITEEINPDLSIAGYNVSAPKKCNSIRNNLVNGENAKYDANKLSNNLNRYGYNYCVFEWCNQKNSSNECIDKKGKYYVVVSFVEFKIPIVGEFMSFPIYGETKILGKTYDY